MCPVLLLPLSCFCRAAFVDGILSWNRGGLFLLSWLCLLTRRFGGPHGSALVPGGRHLYCVVMQTV